MTNNCLVTKLKSAVNNIYLPKFGSYIFTCKALDNTNEYNKIQIFTGSNGPVTLTIIEGDYFYSDKDCTTIGGQNNGKTYEIAENTTYIMGINNLYIKPNVDYTIEISNKYNITGIRICMNGVYPIFNIDELFADNLYYIYETAVVGNLSSLTKTNEFGFYSGKATGLSDIVGNISLLSGKTIHYIYFNNMPNIEGNLSSFLNTTLVREQVVLTVRGTKIVST